MLRLINDDFFKSIDTIEDESVDLFIVDSPYGINYQNQEWDKINFVEFTTSWVEKCVAKLKPTGTMWCFMAKDNLFTHKGVPMGLVNILETYGEVNLENWCVFARQKGRGSSKHLKSLREEVIHFTKSSTYTWNNLQMLREVICPYVKDGRPRGWFVDENGQRVRWTGLGNVWTYSSPQFNGISEKQFHSCQKPVMMIERLIRLSSNEGDLVVDPFMGSGSTALACKLSNRNFIGIELDKDIFNKVEENIKQFNILNFPGYNLKTDKEIAQLLPSVKDKRVIEHIKRNIPNEVLNGKLNRFF